MNDLGSGIDATPCVDTSEVSLAERLAFERLLGDLSALFAGSTSSRPPWSRA